MIVVYHSDNKITEVVAVNHQKIKFDASDTIALGLQKLAIQFPDQKLVWCHDAYKESLNLASIDTVFHHNKMMVSYNPNKTIFFDSKIGYAEATPFITVNKKVSYPTWQMSSLTGVVHASLLLKIKESIRSDKNFDYYLNSVAKLCIPLGLICYSEPTLLKPTEKINTPKASIYILFRFVKQHYRTQWLFLLLLNFLLYEKRFLLLPFIKSMWYKKRTLPGGILDNLDIQSNRKVINNATIDVIIPTIGRKECLYDVLSDLAKQSHLPENVVIVEQNPDADSGSELDYLTNQIWPFVIKHTFTHHAGACNARNIALKEITGEWVFFADDDIRVESNFIEKALQNIARLGVHAVSVSCYQKGQHNVYHSVFQWSGFGSGCSLVLADSLKDCKFAMGYEFGFGEDSDFGMQLRNKGCDILYLPEPSLLHLKAPMGGFRTKPVLAWHGDAIQPKPSPTVMLYQILHLSKEQRASYKTTLFFKYYKLQRIKNPIRYFLNFRKQWKKSHFWANELKKA